MSHYQPDDHSVTFATVDDVTRDEDGYVVIHFGNKTETILEPGWRNDRCNVNPADIKPGMYLELQYYHMGIPVLVSWSLDT